MLVVPASFEGEEKLIESALHQLDGMLSVSLVSVFIF
jgi:hypothetical protein